MKRRAYLSELVELRASTGLWMGVAMAMMASTLLLAGWIFINNPREQVVVIPPEVDKPFKVSGGRYSTDYIEQISTWFLSQVLTYQPDTIEHQHKVFMKYADPASWGALNAQLTKDKEYIKKEQITSAFYLKKFKAQGMVAYVEGTVARKVGSHELDPKKTHWLVKMSSLPNGRIAIKELKEIKDEAEFIQILNS